jgi:hypothetical protein
MQEGLLRVTHCLHLLERATTGTQGSQAIVKHRALLPLTLLYILPHRPTHCTPPHTHLMHPPSPRAHRVRVDSARASAPASHPSRLAAAASAAGAAGPGARGHPPAAAAAAAASAAPLHRSAAAAEPLLLGSSWWWASCTMGRAQACSMDSQMTNTYMRYFVLHERPSREPGSPPLM